MMGREKGVILLPPTLRVVFRFLWYTVSRLFVLALAAALVVLAFFAAMDFMNAQILVKDGLQLRAEVIIKGDDPTALTKVFSKSFLEQDTLLNSTEYRPYAISDMDYRADVNFRIIMPWENTIVLRVTEEVTGISGELLAGSENDDTLSETPPLWQGAVYNVTLTRYEDNWRIVSMELVEELPTPTPSPTPETSVLSGSSVSPTPTAMPTGEVSPEDTEDIIED